MSLNSIEGQRARSRWRLAEDTADWLLSGNELLGAERHVISSPVKKNASFLVVLRRSESNKPEIRIECHALFDCEGLCASCGSGPGRNG